MASDIMSCLFLNYNKKPVMLLAIPVAVKFLHKGNKDLSRNMSSYLSLAAIENADTLAVHVQPILDSVISGSKPFLVTMIFKYSKCTAVRLFLAHFEHKVLFCFTCLLYAHVSRTIIYLKCTLHNRPVATPSNIFTYVQETTVYPVCFQLYSLLTVS